MYRKKQLESELERVTKLIVKEYNPWKIILFGSLAGGRIHEWSDIDLAIIKDTPERFIDRIGRVLEVSHPQISTNIVVYTPEEVKSMEATKHYFWTNEILNKGKTIYDSSG